MTLPWHPRNHQDALDGMLALTLEERGAYNTVLDLIYDRGGPVPDEERWLSGWMLCSVKKWRLLRAALIVKGKIQVVEHAGQPSLMNERARVELQSASTRRRVAAESGASGGRKSSQTKSKDNKNNDEPQATLAGSLKLLTETDTVTEEDPIKPNGLTVPKAKRASKRTPESWNPKEQTLATLVQEGFTAGDIERALTRMRDHEYRVPRSDWDAALRNWLRNDADRKPRNGSPSTPDAKLAAKQANYARAWEGSERAARSRWEP